MIRLCGSGDPEWLELRRKYVTASEVATILGHNPYETPLALFRRKLSGEETPDNAHMRRGREREREIWDKLVACRYLEHPLPLMAVSTRCTYAPGMYVSDEYPWVAATFDGLMMMRGPIPIELKCPSREWDSVPVMYQTQVRTQSTVCMSGLGYLVWACEPDLHLCLSEIDGQLTDEELETTRRFHECLQRGSLSMQFW